MNDYPLFFELGGISVPIEANTDFNQDYEPLAAQTWPPLRFMDGAGAKQTAWDGKLRTILSGSGNAPAGLDGLDYKLEMLLKCGAPLGVSDPSNVMTISAKRRSDAGFEPYGYAIVGGQRIDSPVGMVGNDATVTAVAGATGYGVYYFPEITVWAQAPRKTNNLVDAAFGWTLEAEEK